MQIGFIGSGSMAKALAGKWRHRHDVMLSGRDAAKTVRLASDMGVGAGTAAEAAAFGEVVVLATRHEDVFEAIDAAGGAAAFAGKVVLDINNPVSVETLLSTRTDGRSLTEAIQEALPAAEVAKAFNMAEAGVWASALMDFDGRLLVTLYTADTERAAAVVADLIRDVGAEPLRLGTNAHAYKLEGAAAIVISLLFAGRDPSTVLNLVQPEVKPVR